ncbi:RHS repeat-associated core domain containing protein [Nitzschia inconspicua]|uniref:RHS repeat-associated core domain containing protein n=1 Tax=Nitzschia inconspicua TaxID=303405 RepID=A0A9K3LYU5_9STRA|nr:RHS repeat-associated core domain containing protein [Nitzschia inconspicua]
MVASNNILILLVISSRVTSQTFSRERSLFHRDVDDNDRRYQNALEQRSWQHLVGLADGDKNDRDGSSSQFGFETEMYKVSLHEDAGIIDKEDDRQDLQSGMIRTNNVSNGKGSSDDKGGKSTKSPKSDSSFKNTKSQKKAKEEAMSRPPTSSPIGPTTSQFPSMGEQFIPQQPTSFPLFEPSDTPTQKPTQSPTEFSTPVPSEVSATETSAEPSSSPTESPTEKPVVAPSPSPQVSLTASPTVPPTVSPTIQPTMALQTVSPTVLPTVRPTIQPTVASILPTNNPTGSPIEILPTEAPFSSMAPSPAPAESSPPPSADISTPCETLSREEGMLVALSNVTDRAILEDPVTTQYMAASWLISEDPASVDPCTYETLSQRYALANLFFATDGASWTVNTGWLSGEDECDWSNVECSSGNGLSLVTGLTLSGNNLVGTLPDELKVFISLNTFDVSENKISGSIPKMIGGFGLTSFLAANNQLSGTIPEELWSNVQLKSLQLSSNQLTGTFSGKVGDLSAISLLDLHSNSLTGTIPVLLGRVSSLEVLDLSQNQFSSFVRDSFATFTSLSIFDASFNTLTGPIPSRLFNLESIREISMSDNSMDGNIPENLGSATGLERLRLHNNLLSGTVPMIALGQLPNLIEMHLHGNFLTGSMPASICELRNDAFGSLEILSADCDDEASSRVECNVPSCCTECYPLIKV